MLERLITCPLGHKCESVKDDKLEVCAWLMTLKGTDTQTGEQVDKQMCAVVVQPMMIMDNTKATFGHINAQANLATVLLNGKKDSPSIESSS